MRREQGDATHAKRQAMIPTLYNTGRIGGLQTRPIRCRRPRVDDGPGKELMFSDQQSGE